VSKEEAARRIEEIKEPYKLEILEDISRRYPDSPITIYHCGEPGSSNHWWDLCAGPHVESTGDINPAALELESVAGDGIFTRHQPPRLGRNPYNASSVHIRLK
jgi:threonyl-tRNA synthetase